MWLAEYTTLSPIFGALAMLHCLVISKVILWSIRPFIRLWGIHLCFFQDTLVPLFRISGKMFCNVQACERIAHKQNPKKIAPRFFERNHAVFKPVLNNLLEPGISTMQIARRLDKYFEKSLGERHAYEPQYKVSPQIVDASVARFLNVEVTSTTQLAAEKLQHKLRARPEVTDVLANYQGLLRCV